MVPNVERDYYSSGLEFICLCEFLSTQCVFIWRSSAIVEILTYSLRMFMTEDLVAKIQEHLRVEGLFVSMREDFSAKNPSHRHEIRQDALQTLTAKIAPEKQSTAFDTFLTDKIPQLPNFSLSISHCDLLGGWIAIPLPYQIGLDIESTKRINKKNLAKASTSGDHDFPQSTSESLIWCAKEAAFKCLHPQPQPVFFGKIQIQNWLPLGDHFFQFSAVFNESKNRSSTAGIGYWSPSITVAVAIQFPSGNTKS